MRLSAAIMADWLTPGSTGVQWSWSVGVAVLTSITTMKPRMLMVKRDFRNLLICVLSSSVYSGLACRLVRY